MRFHLALAVLAGLELTIASPLASPLMAQHGGRIASPALTHDTASSATMRVMHAMMTTPARFRRTVTNLPNGVRTLTESDDAGARRLLHEYAAGAEAAVHTSHHPTAPEQRTSESTMPVDGPPVRRIVANAPGGVMITETSTDAPTVTMLQRRARDLTGPLGHDMASMHARMVSHGNAAAGETQHSGHQTVGTHGTMSHTNSDSAFAAVQQRGAAVMGVDQYTSTHRFEALPDGGRIELQRNTDDTAGTEAIRAHLQDIARAFSAGDFSAAAAVHMQAVPGVAVMAAKRDRIRYTVTSLPRGGALRITTGDADVVAAVAQFMAFQRMDHRAP